MVTVNAHFDGKVIVPDEPLALAPNQRIRVSVEVAMPESMRTDFREWAGLARRDGDRPYDASEEDALWEAGPLNPPTQF